MSDFLVIDMDNLQGGVNALGQKAVSYLKTGEIGTPIVGPEFSSYIQGGIDMLQALIDAAIPKDQVLEKIQEWVK